MDAKATPRPNIILILADDMGYSDIGCFGSEIRTPEPGSPGQGGIRFTQAYNCARCCPTRASLLTGLYPHQAGVGHMVNNRGSRPYQGYLRDDCVTIAEVLRAGGYRTLMSGKWHCGGVFARNDPGDWRIGDPERPLPPDRGFDEWWGTPAGAGSYFNPRPLMHNYRFIEPEGDPFYLHRRDQRTGRAHDRRGGPAGPALFSARLLHRAALAAARPRGGRRPLPGPLSRRLGRGAHRAPRGTQGHGHPRQQVAHLAARRDSRPTGRTSSSGTGRTGAWPSMRPRWTRWTRASGGSWPRCAEAGVEQNTLVLFLSDNGGCAELLREDGQRAREWPVTREGKPMRFGNIAGLMPGDEATYQSYDLPWANASNTPFRLYKHWVHEGGISTPLIGLLAAAAL